MPFAASVSEPPISLGFFLLLSLITFSLSCVWVVRCELDSVASPSHQGSLEDASAPNTPQHSSAGPIGGRQLESQLQAVHHGSSNVHDGCRCTRGGAAEKKRSTSASNTIWGDGSNGKVKGEGMSPRNMWHWSFQQLDAIRRLLPANHAAAVQRTLPPRQVRIHPRANCIHRPRLLHPHVEDWLVANCYLG